MDKAVTVCDTCPLKTVTDLTTAQIRKELDDHERRLRVADEVVTQFKLILYMVAGGGLLSFINLVALFTLLKEVASK